MNPRRLALLAACCGLAGWLASCNEDIVEIVGPGFQPGLDLDQRFVRELPIAGDSQIFAVWIETSGEAWVAGSKGLILHFDGSTWRREATGIAATLAGLTRAADGTLLAVGAGGTVLRDRDEHWMVERTPTGSALRAVAAADGLVWVAGNDGTLLQRDQSGWHRVVAPTDLNLTCIAVRGDSLVVGDALGTVWLRNGEAWSSLGEPGSGGVMDLAFTASGRLICSDRGGLHERRQDDWDALLTRSWMPSGLAIVGETVFCGGIYRVDLSVEPPEVERWAMGGDFRLAMAGPELGLAATIDGNIYWYRRDQDDWHLDPRSDRYPSLVSLRDGTVLLQTGQALLAREDAGWNPRLELPEPGPGIPLVVNWPVSGESWSDVFLVQTDIRSRLWAVWHFDGVAWQEQDVIEDKPYVYRPAVLSARGLLLSAAEKIYLGDRSGWRQTPGLAGAQTWRMVQTGSGQIFAFDLFQNLHDDPDTLYRYEDGAWQQALVYSDFVLEDVSGKYPEALYLLGYHSYRVYRAAAGDSLGAPIFYDLGELGGCDTFAEGEDVVYLALGHQGYVYRLGLGEEDGPATYLAGPLGLPITQMTVEPDGGLLVQTSYDGIYRLPAGSF